MTSLRAFEDQTYIPRRVEFPGGDAARADAITTQIVRNALNSAANQMKRVLIRTSFSPIIYEALDFAVAIYDRHFRLLSQAPTLPGFMGTMSFCVEAAVTAIGGEGRVEPGDAILYNLPYGTGSHAQDAAIVMPIYFAEQLIGYAASKGHLADIGAKNPYCTDTIDLFQEGTIFPGVKLYRRGEPVEEIFAIAEANSRVAGAVRGDLLAEVACCRVGVDEVVRVIRRFGLQVFHDCTERMFQHGEAIVRDFVARVPDGRYTATGHLDNDGLDDEPIAFDIALIVAGDEVTFDLTAVPDARRGPMNCPFPSSASACRIVLAMLAGNESPNEGHFMPLRILTRPGSMFHPVKPHPCYMYGWPFSALVETLFEALSKAMPGQIPSGSAADVCGVMLWTFDEERRETIVAGVPLPVGLGAFPDNDGLTMYIAPLAQTTLPSAELQEVKWNFLQFEKWELAPDSAGAGRYRGGMGWDVEYLLTRAVGMMTVIERTKEPGWAQDGGRPGRTNAVILHYPDGSITPTTKVTGLDLPGGTRIKVRCGGGGGYGDPADRPPRAVHDDVALGLMSEAGARADYPHAFT